MKIGSSVSELPFSFGTRFEDEQGTNPEELIGAAHAGCFSMAFSKILADGGHTPKRIQTSAKVHLEKTEGGFGITRIELATMGEVPGIQDEQFQELAEQAKKGCPVSKALAGVKIELEAKLFQ
jgi:osmotically inducible protein OsmC